MNASRMGARMGALMILIVVGLGPVGAAVAQEEEELKRSTPRESVEGYLAAPVYRSDGQPSIKGRITSDKVLRLRRGEPA